MRIAIDYQTFCNQPYGGISRYFERLAEHLLLAQEEVAVFAPLHRNIYLNELSDGVVHGYNVNRYIPRSEGLMLPINHFFAKRAIKQWKPSVVHETFYSSVSSAPVSCPVVITVYDMIHELFSDHFQTNDKTSEIKRMAISRAAHVICISESTRRDLLSLFDIDEKKVSVIHLGVDRFKAANKVEIYQNLTKRPYILYVGGRWAYKNFRAFIRAIASSAKLQKDFDIIAFGGGGFSRAELTLISELGFQADQIRQLGGDDKLLGSLYEQAAAFVYPSLYEGFGLPPLEAMAHGCPVVSSNRSSMPEVIGDAGMYFDPNEIEDIVLAIESVVYSAGKSQALVELGKKRLDQFTWERVARQTLDVYRSLIDIT